MITKKQRDLLLFIHDYTVKNGGVPPSYMDMSNHVNGGRSKSPVHYMVARLVDHGFLEKVENRARGLRVLKLPDGTVINHDKDSSAERINGMKIVETDMVPANEVWVRDSAPLFGRKAG